jgi:hypothetical protein
MPRLCPPALLVWLTWVQGWWVVIGDTATDTLLAIKVLPSRAAAACARSASPSAEATRFLSPSHRQKLAKKRECCLQSVVILRCCAVPSS